MPARFPLLIAAAGLLACSYWLIAVADMPALTMQNGFWAVLALAAAASIALHLGIRSSVTRAADAAASMLRELEQPLPRSALGTVRAALQALSGALSEDRRRLQEEMRTRERAESSLLASQERYAAAVRGADDGIWEWNLRTASVHYSPRWKAMLGYAENEIGDNVDEWRSRIHPQDAERVAAGVEAHIRGQSTRFESEHRLRHRDGSYRWIFARGSAVRDSSGRAYRVIGLHTDISARKHLQEALLDVADGLSTLSGDECFRELTRRFAEAIGVREAFVCECSDFPTTKVRMLARWNRGAYANCVEFDLRGTSCEDVIQTGRPLFVPGNIAERWPLEKTFDRESYLGLPCIDTRGQVIGHIACADGQEMRRELPHLAILKIFAIRAAVELERRMLERERLMPAPQTLY